MPPDIREVFLSNEILLFRLINRRIYVKIGKVKEKVFKEKNMLFKTNDPATLFFQIIAVALCIVILVLGSAYGIAVWYLGRMNSGTVYVPTDDAQHIDDGKIIDTGGTVEPMATDSDGFTHPSEAGSLQENIKNWMNNGAPVKDDGVQNILLIGMDNEDMNVNSRADAMVIFSLNHNTKTITLASVLRDQYCYIPHSGKFEKLHHACSYKGPAYQIEMIESYYKIKIDNYAVVNFYSLPKIIDKLGGIDVEITSAEAEYMNENWTSVKAGTQHLNGEQALIYMRIRHETGGDEARVGRQQKVIGKIIEKMKSYSKTKMISLVNDVIPYIRTGYSGTQAVSLATDALLNGWLNYTVKTVSLPDSDCATEFRVKESSGRIWYWKVDFPVAAQKMQMALYGKTNIDLDKNRKSWIK